MSLIAYRISDGQEVESFSIAPETWDIMRREPLGAYVMPYTGWRAVLKRSIRGLQFFAYAPGYSGVKPKPESEPHRQAKVQIVTALRAAGYPARVERPGVSPDNEKWQADVFCEAQGRVIAFEIQLSQQTLDEYLAPTKRYRRSGIKCVWFVRSGRHYKALTDAIWHRYFKPKFGRVFHPELPAFALDIGEPSEGPPYSFSVAVLGEQWVVHLPLAEFAIGIAEGKLVYSKRNWMWREQGALSI